MKKKLLVFTFTALLTLSSVSCSSSDSSSGEPANALASAVSSETAGTELSSDTDSSSVQSESESDTSSQSDEKIYTITGGYENSWDISDKETIAEIDKWLEKVSAVCKDYELKEGDFPRAGGTLGYIIKTDGDNYDKMYFVTTSRLDLGQEYEHQENFTINQKPYELPWDYIDEIEAILAQTDPQAKTYTITESHDDSWDITDREAIAEIDTWLSEVMYICEEHKLEKGDYPEVGGTEGIIIKTDGDNYEKMYFIETDRLDLAQYIDKEYKHQANFTVNHEPYELPWDYIDRITEIVKNAKQ